MVEFEAFDNRGGDDGDAGFGLFGVGGQVEVGDPGADQGGADRAGAGFGGRPAIDNRRQPAMLIQHRETPADGSLLVTGFASPLRALVLPSRLRSIRAEYAEFVAFRVG